MEDDEEHEEGFVPVAFAVTVTMEADEGKRETLFPVSVTMATTDEEESNREWSIHVTLVTEASTVEDEEYWKYEIGQNPRKGEKEDKEDRNIEIINGQIAKLFLDKPREDIILIPEKIKKKIKEKWKLMPEKKRITKEEEEDCRNYWKKRVDHALFQVWGSWPQCS